MSTESFRPDSVAVDSQSVVRVRDVVLRYGKTVALDAVNVEVGAGILVGLIGPDGVGKSSLLSLIAGARAVQAGKVEVLNGDMSDARHRRDVAPHIAYMPQGLGKNLYPTLSVFENIDFWSIVRPRTKRARATDRKPPAKHWSGSLRPSASRQALGRHEAKAWPVLRADS